MHRQNKTIIYVVLMGCLLLALNVKAFPLIVCNQAGVAYSGDGPKQSITNGTIEGMIIEGAGYILEGNEGIQQVLRYMELQYNTGLDTTTLNSIIDHTLVTIQKARTTYEGLIRTAENTPYNVVTLTSLKAFPYEDLQTNADLNSVIFQEVVSFLRNGDVTGIFKRTYNSILVIEGLLLNIKAGLTTNPGEVVTRTWELNETTSELLLFGSYVARVFAKL